MHTHNDEGPALGLVGDSSIMTLERRRVPRYAAAGTAMADVIRTDGSHAIRSVTLADSSACGLGLLTDAPIEEGVFVRVFIGLADVPARSGVVARCIEAEDVDGNPIGYRVGLDTGVSMAA